MLKKTGVVLEQITDIDMYQMIEQGLRGGISVISHRYAKANNKYVDGYDETKPSSYITYFVLLFKFGTNFSTIAPYIFILFFNVFA